MSEKYFGNFPDRERVADDFFPSYEGVPVPEDFPTDEEILFASYGGGGYDGDAHVLYERDGKLYEVHGSHCSCYGLEGQWEPEETSLDALAMRKRPDDDGYHFLHDHDKAAQEAYWFLVDALLAAREQERLAA